MAWLVKIQTAWYRHTRRRTQLRAKTVTVEDDLYFIRNRLTLSLPCVIPLGVNHRTILLGDRIPSLLDVQSQKPPPAKLHQALEGYSFACENINKYAVFILVCVSQLAQK